MKGESQMIKFSIVQTVFLVLVLLLPAQAGEVLRCKMCGMDAAKSQTMFVARPKEGKPESLCSLHCVVILEKLDPTSVFEQVETRDYSSGELIDARKALYLEDSNIIPKGSMAPFLPAFKDRATAEQYSQRFQGKVVDYARAVQLAKDFHPKGSGH